MHSQQSFLASLEKSLLWKLIGIVFIPLVLLTALFVYTDRLLSQEISRPTSIASAWETVVIFPNSVEIIISHQEETKIQTAVPNGTISGTVFVNSETGTSNTVPFQIGANFVPTDAQEASTWESTFSGTLIGNTTWNTNLLLTGDVIVPAGITLTIEPGTTIFVSTNDDRNSGEWNDKSELQIFGTLLVNGTESDPVFFTSNATDKAAEDWGGIQIRENSTTSHISGCMIRYAVDAIRIQIHLAPGGGSVWATVQNCTLQYNQRGISFRARPGYPDGDDAYVSGEIKNNLITNNSTEGISIYNASGYKDATTNPLIINNTIQNNNTGIRIKPSSWWLGYVDDHTTINNNSIHNNLTYGIFIEAQGSGDTSGSDTNAKPIIENNLLYNNNTNILLSLDPMGSDGLQDFQPTIRYNSIYDAPFGIVISDTEPYDSFIPTIDHNVFKGFDDPSSYAFANLSSRTINVEQNYWGKTPDEWDQGMPSSSITGTVYSTMPLISTSAPIVTRFASSSSQFGENVTIHGANFGAILKVYLPAILNQTFSGMDPIFIGDAIPQRNVVSVGEVFYNTTIQVPLDLPSTGTFYLSTQPDTLTPVLVDDEIVLKLNNTILFNHDFSTSGTPEYSTLSIPRATMERMAGQTITVEYHDIYGAVVKATDMWLIWIP